MVPIVFGLPLPETFEAAERGEIAVGGCILTGEDPTHRCAACGEDVILDEDAPLACVSCGRLLLDDSEDDPTGPLCGERVREVNFAAVEELGQFGDHDADRG
jgi:predicted RNA-binding Zn-ribbon protein involved in translation (DUF1610 family)